MPLKSTTSFPPGGFTYQQPESKLKFSQLIPLPDQAKLVAAHRKANGFPRSTTAEAAQDIEEWTCLRLNNDPEWCITDTQKKTAGLPLVRRLGQAAQAAGESVSKALAGARILYEWFGEGGVPVEHALAQSRANCCVACPKNSADKGLLSTLSATAHRHLEHRSEMKMSVAGEERLGVCLVCHCPMKLKIHTPIDLIAEHTTKETMRELDNIPTPCWVRDEVRNLKPN